MASLLVYVDAARLQALFEGRARVPGTTWAIGHGEFPQPQLDRLDELAVLFVITLEAGKAIAVATLAEPRVEAGVFVGGDAILHDLDVSHMLPRLGCSDVADLPVWGLIPRILPPGDVDLLSYTLKLAVDGWRPPPVEVVAGDPVAERLRAAVFADPRSDDARMIYADRLQDLGDPRGELIALQLARGRTMGAVSARETELVRQFGGECAQPLTRYLNRGFELRRGFLSACVVNELVAMPDEVVADPAWATVERLETRNFELLTASQLVSATRVCIAGRELPRLAQHDRALPFEVLAGPEFSVHHRTTHSGVWLEDPVGWRVVMQIGALSRLRVLSVNLNIPIAGSQFAALFRHGLVAGLMRSRLGSRLRHLDLFTHLANVDAVAWRRAFDQVDLRRLTIRCALDATTSSNMICVALERGSPHRLVIQLDQPLGDGHVTALLRVVAPLSRGIRRIELEDLGAPTLAAERQRGLISRLGAMFSQVVPNASASTSLAP